MNNYLPRVLGGAEQEADVLNNPEYWKRVYIALSIAKDLDEVTVIWHNHIVCFISGGPHTSVSRSRNDTCPQVYYVTLLKLLWAIVFAPLDEYLPDGSGMGHR